MFRRRTRQRKTEQLTDKTIFYAQFADASYDTIRSKRLHQYMYDQQLSNNKSAIYVNNTTVIMSNRGTVASNASDIGTDVKVARGSFITSIRYLRTERLFNRILQKYPNHKIILTGHSLGGTVNMELIYKYKDRIDEVHNFNPGCGLTALLNQYLRRIPAQKQVHQHFILGDAISAICHGDKKFTNHYYKAKDNLNPHTLKQFLFQ